MFSIIDNETIYIEASSYNKDWKAIFKILFCFDLYYYIILFANEPLYTWKSFASNVYVDLKKCFDNKT